MFLWVDMFVLTTLCKKLNVFYHFQHLLEAKQAENGAKIASFGADPLKIGCSLPWDVPVSLNLGFTG